MVREHGPEHPSQSAAITSIAGKFSCTAETLRNWVRVWVFRRPIDALSGAARAGTSINVAMNRMYHRGRFFRADPVPRASRTARAPIDRPRDHDCERYRRARSALECVP